MTTRPASRMHVRSPFRLGLILIVLLLGLAVPMFLREQIAVALRGGETLTAHLAADNFIRAYKTEVKLAGVPVGSVTSVDRAEDGGALIGMTITGEAYEALGSAPSAAIRPTTLLGGRYYIGLVPGGLPGRPEGDIPADRTRLPVEVDDVAAVLQPDVRASGQSVIGDLDATLREGGEDALLDLLADAPGTLDPATGVLTGLQGERPATDLPALVSNLETTARVLTDREGQIPGIVEDLDAVSAVLDRRSGDVAAALDTLPATLDSTNTGLDALDGSLGELRATVDDARPIVASLDALLEEAGPVLVEARPLVADLRALLVDARPLVERLVPTATQLTTVSENVRGPVLDRVNGPILDTVNSPFVGTGIYAGNGGDHLFYEAVGYMISNLNREARYTDESGAVVSLQFGAGPGSVAGLPVSLEQMFNHFARATGQGGDR